MKRFFCLPFMFILCLFLVSCSEKQPISDCISYERPTHLVSGIYQYSTQLDHCVYVTFLDDHGKEFIAEAQSRSLSEIPFEFDDGATYEIIYYSKSDDEEPVRYTDIVKIKLAEYDLNIIDEKNDEMIH